MLTFGHFPFGANFIFGYGCDASSGYPFQSASVHRLIGVLASAEYFSER